MSEGNESLVDFWPRMHGAIRRKATSLRREVVPREPGTYAWYRTGEPLYVGAADELWSTVWGGHLSLSPSLMNDDFPRRVAAHLSISTAAEMESGGYVLEEHELREVREFINGCEVAWLVTQTHREAGVLSDALRSEWAPMLVR